MRRAKILFTSTLDLPFIADDVHLLNRYHDVDRLTTLGPFAPLTILQRIIAADLSFTWFASSYSFWVVLFGRMLGKRSVIVVGGVDAARRRDLGYGIWLNPFKACLVRYAVRHADRVLVVAPVLKEQLRQLCAYPGGNISWVPMGYDVTRWIPVGSSKPQILTVAACRNLPRLRAKGVDFLAGCAEAMPDVSFTLIGTGRDTVLRAGIPVPANLTCLPYVSRAELANVYSSYRVYFLPSATEGMPNSLCEAMLCGCIPVATEVGAVPEILGGDGFRVRYGDIPDAIHALRRALDAPPSSGDAARQRILDNFLLARREEELLKTIEELLG